MRPGCSCRWICPNRKAPARRRTPRYGSKGPPLPGRAPPPRPSHRSCAPCLTGSAAGSNAAHWLVGRTMVDLISVSTVSPTASLPDRTSVLTPSLLPRTKSRGSGLALGFACTQTRPRLLPSCGLAAGGGGLLSSASGGGVKRRAALGTSRALWTCATLISAVAVSPGRSSSERLSTSREPGKVTTLLVVLEEL